MEKHEVGTDGEIPYIEGQEKCVQVIVIDKRSKDAEVTFLNGSMAVDGMGSPFMVYVSGPGHHRTTKDLRVGMANVITGHVIRNQIPDLDEGKDGLARDPR